VICEIIINSTFFKKSPSIAFTENLICLGLKTIIGYVRRSSDMSIIPVICVKCKKEFTCDTERNQSEAYKSLNSQMIIINRCMHCGYPNRIEVPASGG
jgi:hypothetical protein